MCFILNKYFVVSFLFYMNVNSFSQTNIYSYSLQKKFTYANLLFESSKFDSAKTLFTEIIRVDKYNIFWESYLYLSQIFLSEKDTLSSLSIMDQGLKNDSPSLNAHNMYLVAQIGIKENISIDFNDINSYHYLLERINPTSIHEWPTKLPAPKCGIELFKKEIMDIVSTKMNINKSELYSIQMAVTKKGFVARVSLSDNFSILNDKIKDELYEFIFDSKWFPAEINGKKINCMFAIPLKLDEEIVPQGKKF